MTVHTIQQNHPYGQIKNSWKNLTATIAKVMTGCAISDYPIYGTVKTGRLKRIQHVINAGSWPEYFPNLIDLEWEGLMQYISTGRGLKFPVSVTCDLYVQDPRTGKRYAYFLKDPLFDFFTAERERMRKFLLLHFMDESKIDAVFFAIPYRVNNTKVHMWKLGLPSIDEFARKMTLMGDEFWGRLGALAA